ncbi:hypothetical protein BDN72DRAFT_842179 [Pluteus cervinus]|uniref:Uncharacterized protein n=1 Tax=Pluteus cervinus TaxID=181527 RepID=A0ACD3AQE3_9AGAR|nr:hypothetical protein BDN72DRAFT_842179 [Pluteus cervinus]
MACRFTKLFPNGPFPSSALEFLVVVPPFCSSPEPSAGKSPPSSPNNVKSSPSAASASSPNIKSHILGFNRNHFEVSVRKCGAKHYEEDRRKKTDAQFDVFSSH